MIEFGYCGILLGCVGMTAPEAYTAISKVKGLTALVLEGSDSVPDCDVVVVDTVATLMNVRPFLHSGMIVMVCDSPVRISELQEVVGYDFTGEVFGTYELIPPPKTLPKVLPQPVKVSRRKADLVKEAIQSIVVRGFLSDFNALNSKMNAPARKMLRIKLTTLMLGVNTVENIESYLESIAVDGEVFIAKLRSKYFKQLSEAVVYFNKGHSLTYVKSHFGITDNYEITYFAKLISQGDK